MQFRKRAATESSLRRVRQLTDDVACPNNVRRAISLGIQIDFEIARPIYFMQTILASPVNAWRMKRVCYMLMSHKIIGTREPLCIIIIHYKVINI